MAKFIKVHSLSGKEFFINADYIVEIKHCMADNFDNIPSHSELRMAGGDHSIYNGWFCDVKEAPDEIIKMAEN